MDGSSAPFDAAAASRIPEDVRVVHVDDDPAFAELTAEFLQRADDRLSVTTCTDPEAALDAVVDDPPDCVVSDYEMPRLDGLELHGALTDAGVDVPFILFTGKGSEAVAADAMSAGVTDYIQKSGTDTYDVVVNRVLDAVESRQRQRAVDRAVDHYTALVEGSHLPVYLYDEDGTILYANEASTDLFGVDSREEVVGMSFDEVTSGESRAGVEQRLERLSEGERVPATSLRIEGEDGVDRTTRISCVPTPHHGEAVGQTIAHDVSKASEYRRELEEFRETMQAALDAANAGAWVWDVDAGDVTRFGVSSLVGGGLDAGVDGFLDVVHEADRERLESAYRDAADQGGEFRVQFRADRGGETRYFEDRGAAVDTDGDTDYVVGVLVDITDVVSQSTSEDVPAE
ncbi:MAG: PAS domain S-box protein [Halobacterium sp.]